MFDAKKYYERLNSGILGKYQRHLNDIKTIKEQTDDYEKYGELAEIYKFFNRAAMLILYFAGVEERISGEYFESNSFESLLKENNDMYSELLPENYGESYANPAYAVKIFGDGIGQMLSTFYKGLFDYVDYSFKHKIYKMYEYNEVFVETFVAVKQNEFSFERARKLYAQNIEKNMPRDIKQNLIENQDKDYGFYNDIILNSDFNDLRYLFKCGKYITQNEIGIAKFLNTYDDEKLNKLSKSIALDYVKGFAATSKDIKKRSVVKIIYNVGQEKIVKKLMVALKEYNLDSTAVRPVSTDFNKQFDYDHKFDIALLFDENYAKAKEEAYDEAASEVPALKDYSGIMYFDKFGEAPFAPQSKKECLKLNEKASEMYMKHNNNLRKLIYKYMPEEETSFCIVAFPTPEIGNNFEEIFNETVKINMLDNSKYERIQKKIIDVLDMADYVHVAGADGNDTDVMVKMHEIGNPEKETNFVNCVADVNIPVGEVFTSPVLKGTNGVLHLNEIFLDGLKYVDLKIKFKDGYVDDYSCKNFEDEEQNKKYIEENILFPYKTLPLGEFAIGTNTTAYVMAEKYNIVSRLPVLIIEKTGPHFAIGDTCFSRSEDIPQYNMIDGKEIIATDNEKSILRKTDVNEAYTNIHTDMTLPYDSIGEISAVLKDGREVAIMKNGRFVVDGTEELNKAFEK